jgi:hypothetical protein
LCTSVELSARATPDVAASIPAAAKTIVPFSIVPLLSTILIHGPALYAGAGSYDGKHGADIGGAK